MKYGIEEEHVSGIRRGVLHSGFALEWQTTQILSRNNGVVLQNLLLPKVFEDGSDIHAQVEIDVAAYFYLSHRGYRDTFLVECKGTLTDNALVLIEASDSVGSFPSVYFSNQRVLIATKESFMVDRNRGPFLCHTGDFFSKKSEGWDKLSKQEERSNLFKGIQQIVSGIDAYFGYYRKDPNNGKYDIKLNPLIVTNAKLMVARFQKEDGSIATTEPDIVGVPWAVYKNPLAFGSNNYLGKVEWEFAETEKNASSRPEMRIPYIWIVHIDYLERFIDRSDHAYSDLD